MYGLKDALRHALKGRWSGHGEYFVPARLEWFYRVKAAICLLLNLEPRSQYARKNFWENHIIVTVTDSGTTYCPGEPTYHWYEALTVGHGLLRNWWATYDWDSD